MDNINHIFGEKEFSRWLLCCEQNLSETQVLEKMEQLVALNNRVWKQIGDNIKKYDIDSNEPPVLFNFNPFLWIKYCFKNKDTQLLSDVVTVYSSIMRRLLEKVTLEADIIDRKIENGEPIRFSEVRVGDYQWSPYVLRAYENFEKTLPLPSRSHVINWDNAWKLYVRFINSYCPRTDLNSEMSEISEIYKDYLDPFDTDDRDRPSSKSERELDEFIRKMEDYRKDSWNTYYDRINIKNPQK